jgi:excisionase family DNA binding protein
MSHLYLSVGEIAGLLRTSEKWIYQQLAKGNIPGAFRIGRTWLIDQEIFTSKLKEKAQKPIQVKRDSGSKNRHSL